MTMPLNNNPGVSSTVKISESNEHFLVSISYHDRDRAKKIPGRAWDGTRKVWVFPKDQFTYEALIEEFRKDADVFDIQRPKTKRPDGINPPNIYSDNEFEELSLDNNISSGNPSKEQINIYGELENIRMMVSSLTDISLGQSRIIEEISVNQATQVEKTEAIPESLDLNKQREVELFERTLVKIVCSINDEDKSLSEWMKLQKPLLNSSDFISQTHEMIKGQLKKLVGDEDYRGNFPDLVYRVRDEKLIYWDGKDKTVQPIGILLSLNVIRNLFAHSYGLTEAEKRNKSMLYLINLSLVWQNIVMEEENINEQQ